MSVYHEVKQVVSISVSTVCQYVSMSVVSISVSMECQYVSMSVYPYLWSVSMAVVSISISMECQWSLSVNYGVSVCQ